MLAIHHAVVDAVSWRTVVGDLATAWSQMNAGAAIELTPPGTSMRRWSQVLTELATTRLDDMANWLERLPEHGGALGDRHDIARDRVFTVHRVTREDEFEVTEQV